MTLKASGIVQRAMRKLDAWARWVIAIVFMVAGVSKMVTAYAGIPDQHSLLSRLIGSSPIYHAAFGLGEVLLAAWVFSRFLATVSSLTCVATTSAFAGVVGTSLMWSLSSNCGCLPFIGSTSPILIKVSLILAFTLDLLMLFGSLIMFCASNASRVNPVPVGGPVEKGENM